MKTMFLRENENDKRVIHILRQSLKYVQLQPTCSFMLQQFFLKCNIDDTFTFKIHE